MKYIKKELLSGIISGIVIFIVGLIAMFFNSEIKINAIIIASLAMAIFIFTASVLVKELNKN